MFVPHHGSLTYRRLIYDDQTDGSRSSLFRRLSHLWRPWMGGPVPRPIHQNVGAAKVGSWNDAFPSCLDRRETRSPRRLQPFLLIPYFS